MLRVKNIYGSSLKVRLENLIELRNKLKNQSWDLKDLSQLQQRDCINPSNLTSLT